MHKISVNQKITIREAMKKLNESGHKCLVIVEKNRLMGTLSDGDLRKAILQGYQWIAHMENFYQKTPTILMHKEYSTADAKKLFIKNKFDIIPVIDENSNLVDVLFWESLFNSKNKEIKKELNIPVVIMAGGKGTRLEPFTKVLPKTFSTDSGQTNH